MLKIKIIVVIFYKDYYCCVRLLEVKIHLTFREQLLIFSLVFSVTQLIVTLIIN